MNLHRIIYLSVFFCFLFLETASAQTDYLAVGGGYTKYISDGPSTSISFGNDELIFSQREDRFKGLYTSIIQFKDDAYERRAFLCLDILSSLESKIEKRPISQVIKEKLKIC